MSSRDTMLRPSRHVRATVTSQGAMLLDLRGRGRWYALSPSAARWWGYVADGRTLHEATEAVAERYNLPLERVRTDMEPLIAGLVAHRLLEPPNRRRWGWRRW